MSAQPRRRSGSRLPFSFISNQRKRRAARRSSLSRSALGSRIEQLERRLVLTSSPLINVVPDPGLEGSAVNVSVEFTDAVAPAGGELEGLKPNDFTAWNDTDPGTPWVGGDFFTAGLNVTGIAINTSLAIPEMVVTYNGGVDSVTIYGVLEP